MHKIVKFTPFNILGSLLLPQIHIVLGSQTPSGEILVANAASESAIQGSAGIGVSPVDGVSSGPAPGFQGNPSDGVSPASSSANGNPSATSQFTTTTDMVTVTHTVPLSQSNSQAPLRPTTSSSRHSPSVGPIVGGVVGGVLALLLLGGLILWRRRRIRTKRAVPLPPTPPVGEMRLASTLAVDRPTLPAVIESQAAMLEKANAMLSSDARVPATSEPEGSVCGASSSSNPVTETQFRAMAERLALVEAALSARGEDMPPNYSPG